MEFVGEEGIDTGGLTREFFSLFERSVTPPYITVNGSFVHDSIALRYSHDTFNYLSVSLYTS